MNGKIWIHPPCLHHQHNELAHSSVLSSVAVQGKLLLTRYTTVLVCVWIDRRLALTDLETLSWQTTALELSLEFRHSERLRLGLSSDNHYTV